MRCEDFQKLISLRQDGQLTPEENGKLEEHLETCRDCGGFAASVSQFDDAIAQSPKASMPEALEIRIRKSISEKSSQAEKQKRSLIKGYIRIPRSAIWATAIIFIFLIHKAFFASPANDIEMRTSQPQPRTAKVHTILLSQADIVQRQAISNPSID